MRHSGTYLQSMNCWNCGYQVEENSKICRRCEADQSEHEHIDPEVLTDAATELESHAPGALEALKALAGQHDTAEDFANAILVGPCPECGSLKVGDCDDDPDYVNSFLGRCFACGNVWCTECGYKLKKGEKRCPDEENHSWDIPEAPDIDELR
jgi:RNA polymerase subunit RPABC4/transcription elongation factor Spt4